MSDGATYLDHAATSFPKAPGVAGAVARFLGESAGNPGRGGHRMTAAASRAVEAAREDLASLVGADPERVFFGGGATFWINCVLEDWLEAGDRVVTSTLEHNAVMRPLRHLEEQRGIDVDVACGAGESAHWAGAFAAAVARRPTRLVALTHASNVSGQVLPIREIAEAVAPVPVLVDGAQTAGSFPFDFGRSGVAAYVCSGHKGLLGPTGTGVLLLERSRTLRPLVRGGTGSNSESERMPDLLPDLLEAGTPNTVGIVGLGAAVRWLADEGVEAVHSRGQQLVERLVARLTEIPGVQLVGYNRDEARVATLSLVCERLDAGELAAWLDRERGFQVRAGLHCAPSAHRALGTFPDGTLRASLGPFTTVADVDRFARAMADAVVEGRSP